MSYDLLYRRCFIKVDNDKVIPLLEVGSSNCFEQDRRGNFSKRARGWHVMTYFTKGGFIMTHEALKARIDEERATIMERYKDSTDPAYSDDSWGYWTSIAIAGRSTSGTTFGAYRSYFMNGAKEAKTIEELAKYGITINIGPGYRSKENSGAPEMPSVAITSTEQLIETLDAYKEFYKDGRSYALSLWGERGLELMDMERKRKRRKEKTYIETNEFWALEYKDCGYFVKKRGRSVFFSPYASDGMKFRTEEQMNAYLKKSTIKEHLKPVFRTIGAMVRVPA